MPTRRALPFIAAICLAATGLAPIPVTASDPEFTLVIHEHRFEPAELKVPAGQKVRLLVDNRDATPEEFESYALNREKVIPGRTKSVIYVGPLRPGRYEFFGEFNPATARGWLVAE